MHETMWKCKCDAMHEHTWSFKQNLTQKFHKNHFSKTPKPRSKWMKCMIKERKEIILVEEHKIWTEDEVGKVKRLSEKCLGERKECLCQEKSKRNERKIAQKQYIENTNLDWLRAIESCRALILDRFIYQLAIKSYQRQKKSRWIE